MSRTYRNTKGSSKRLLGNARRDYPFFASSFDKERNAKIDYNDVYTDKSSAYLLRNNVCFLYRKHSKFFRKNYRKQEKMRFNKNLHQGLKYENWEELYLIYSNKDTSNYI